MGTLRIAVLPLFILLFCWKSLWAEKLEFQYREGEKYRYLGISDQEVLFNGEHLQNNQDTYKISYDVKLLPDGRGQLVGKTLYISVRKARQAAEVNEEFTTDFIRDRLGVYEMAPDKIMPVVRGVPTFPDKDLNPGDSWMAPGEELEDLSSIQAFTEEGPIEPLRVPLTVKYTYQGQEDHGGKKLDVVIADYTLFKRTNLKNRKLYPVMIGGSSHQTIYFDPDKGRIDSYKEDYSLVLTLNNGTVYEFTGQSHADLTEAVEMDKPKLIDEVKKELKDRGLGDVAVRPSDQGVVLNLDNIQFPPDSALLIPSEREKIRLIGEILNRYKDRDILVEGHTALAGRPEDRLKLSQDRAAAVGNALVEMGVRNPNQIVYRGWGSDRPLVANDNEENKKKNRRVEITILEN